MKPNTRFTHLFISIYDKLFILEQKQKRIELEIEKQSHPIICHYSIDQTCNLIFFLFFISDDDSLFLTFKKSFFVKLLFQKKSFSLRANGTENSFLMPSNTSIVNPYKEFFYENGTIILIIIFLLAYRAALFANYVKRGS